MEVKIDTKEKFTVVTPVAPNISANIAAAIAENCNSILQKEPKNVILNMEQVSTVDEPTAEMLTELQQKFYDNNASFVICSLTPAAEEGLDKLDLLELLNITPSQSEAWDIVQMEEIERELLDGDDIAFDSAQ